jgi:hypothetical protein
MFCVCPVCVLCLPALDSDRSNGALSARSTVTDWLELCELLRAVTSFCMPEATFLTDECSTKATLFRGHCVVLIGLNLIKMSLGTKRTTGERGRRASDSFKALSRCLFHSKGSHE